MYNHEPKNYDCPFCHLINGGESEINSQEHIFYRDANLIAYVSPKWLPYNPGCILIVPNKHIENIYTLPKSLGHKIFDLTKEVAIALKEVYKCDGVSTRQHNEPAGNQDVWYYHVHVFPRYAGDELYINHNNARWVSKEERLPYAEKLRKYFSELSSRI